MHTSKLLKALSLATLMGSALPAAAVVIAFGNSSPTGNTAAFTASVTGLGGTIDSSINFDTHPLGLLNPNFYPGVTLTATGDSNTVMFGAGPAQGNTSSTPLSTGEGSHSASNFLFDDGAPSSLAISFDQAVFGVGLHVIDYFNPTDFNNPLTIEAFDGPNGTGTSLGLFSSVAFNFQNNNMYFLGVTSSENNIRSLVFTDVNSNTGDTTGIDDILFGVGVTQVPEPGTLALLGIALAGLGFRRGKRSLS